MYLGSGTTTISNGSITVTRLCDVDYKHKKIYEKYTDVNNNPVQVLLGYEITFQLRYTFESGDATDHRNLRRLLNLDSDIAVTPRTTYNANLTKAAFDCYLELKKDKQLNNLDIIEIEAIVSGLETVPYIEAV